MNIIEIKNLQKIYKTGKNEFCALKDVSFSINAGEFVSIVGTSGSGKSSLMNILGCLDPVRNGTYILNGRNITDFSDGELADVRNTQIGFIFQSYNLLPKLSVLENVCLPLIYHNISQKEREKTAIEILTTLGLKDKIYSMPGDVSGGQRQRVAIARALVNRPKIILADEPTGNLDSATEKEIIQLFKEIIKIFNTTIIVVTHNEEVAYWSDRVITLFDGKLYGDISLNDFDEQMKGYKKQPDMEVLAYA